MQSRDEAPAHTTEYYRNETRSQLSSRPGRRSDRPLTPPPSLPESRRLPRNADPQLPQRSTHTSDDSASSTTSSLLDRLKLGGSYASSRTSLEEDQKSSYSTLRTETTKSLRRRPLSEDKLEQDSEVTSGVGDALWNRVATVASDLTVSVSKAWAANITTFAGEETPPGQESRLTRAMKAYHLEKARSPTDLPPWLFNERDRRLPASYDTPNGDIDYSPQRPRSVNEIPKSRGLRDIYDAHRPESPVSRPPQRLPQTNDLPPSKATDRLKALRDAKRTATSNAFRPPSTKETPNFDPNPDRAGYTAPITIAQRPRVGLPPGPRRA
ncbi:hypothetical protein DXG01_014570 [Tephrocybe rancida]|nr:hypothetical protein DXG01_014570 [Tephrocybe rancida]